MKLKCSYWRCDWHGTDAEVLKAPDPFNDGDTLWACPECRDMTIVNACTVHDCWEEGTCGGPNPYEPPGHVPYVPLCGKHHNLGPSAAPPANEGERK